MRYNNNKLSNDLRSMKQNITAQVHEKCAQFIDKLSEILYTHTPLKPLSKRKGIQRKKPWMTQGIIKSISTKIKCMQNAIKKINHIYFPIIKNIRTN